MKSDVDAAVKPVKDVDARKVESDIENLLGITPGGTFALRGELEAAIATVQQKLDDALAAIREHDPRKYLQQIDEKLADISKKIGEISPELSLEPVQQAIDQVKGAIGDFDLSEAIQPLRDAFDTVIEAIEEYSPAKLLEPIEQRIDEARESIVAAIALTEWRPTVDSIADQGMALLDVLDPAQLEPQLTSLLEEAHALIDKLPDSQLGGFIGSLVSSAVTGTGTRAYPWTFDVVLGWIRAGAGNEFLAPGARRASRTRWPQPWPRSRRSISTRCRSSWCRRPALCAPKSSASPASWLPIRRSASSSRRPSPRLDIEVTFAGLTSNRQRFVTALQAAVPLGETLRRTGLSEVDTTIAALKSALAPFFNVTDVVRQFLAHMGITGFEDGIAGILRAFLAVAPPSRLVGLLSPIFEALRGRVQVVVDAVLGPIRDGIDSIETIVAAFDITPLREGIEAAVQTVLDEVQALSPDSLLAEPLASFESLKQNVLDFNPLENVIEVLDALKEAAQRGARQAVGREAPRVADRDLRRDPGRPGQTPSSTISSTRSSISSTPSPSKSTRVWTSP